MCKPLVRSTEAVSGPQAGAARIPLEELAMADRVCYAYYTGRLAILDDQYLKGAELLDFALSHCHKSASVNKKRILVHLIPVLAPSHPRSIINPFVITLATLTAHFHRR